MPPAPKTPRPSGIPAVCGALDWFVPGGPDKSRAHYSGRPLTWQYERMPENARLTPFLAAFAAFSALLGSLVCVVPNAFLGLRLIAPRRDPGALKRAAWFGEIGKLALTVVFFTLVFTQVKPLSAVALFAGYIATQLAVFSGFLMQSDIDTDNLSNTNGS